MTLSERELRIDRAVRAGFQDTGPFTAREHMRAALISFITPSELARIRDAWKALRPPQPRDKHGRFA